jgi:hypothetical protein
MNTHACIKITCGQKYESDDPDAYYCPPCFEAKKALAAQIDAQVANQPPRLPRTSSYQDYENDPNKVGGFIRVSL